MSRACQPDKSFTRNSLPVRHCRSRRRQALFVSGTLCLRHREQITLTGYNLSSDRVLLAFRLFRKSYMISSMIRSMMDRSPRAPVPFSIACRATSVKASSVKLSLQPSISNRLSYWRTSAFLGSVSTRTSDGSSNGVSAETIGIRPTSSGIKPTQGCRH